MKALLGSRGKKIRNLEQVFIADGMQSLRSALMPKVPSAPIIERIYATEKGLAKLRSEFSSQVIDSHETILVSDQVMNEMADTESPQGIFALCKFRPLSLEQLTAPKQVAYFWQIQDPGNAGTAIRTADACGFDAVAFSELSVDIYRPKVVRSTAGSLWNIPVLEDISLLNIESFAAHAGLNLYAFDRSGESELNSIHSNEPSIAIFGNEARGLPELPPAFRRVRIPMRGHAESFNVASAAAIVLFHMSNSSN